MLDRNFTKFILLTPGTQQLGWQHAREREPAGLDADDGERAAFQRHRLSARRHREPRPDPRASSSSTRTSSPSARRRSRRRTTTRSSGRRPPAWCRCRQSRASNTFHGSGFEFFQNEALQARNPFTQARPDPTTGKFLPETKKNQFGGSVGGPIMQNKWFFFGDYQGTRSDRGGSVLTSVPTAARGRATSANTASDIYDPATGQEFAQRDHPARTAVAAGAQYPSADSHCRTRRAGTTARATTSSTSGIEKFTQNSINVRIDGRLSEAINTFGRYTVGKFHRDGPTAFGAGGGPRSSAGQSRRRLRRHEPEPRVRRRLRDFVQPAGRLPLRLVPVQGRCAAV